MATRMTRASTARQSRAAVKSETEQLSSPPTTPAPSKRGASKKESHEAIDSKSANKGDKDSVKAEPITPNIGRKRARATAKKEDDVNDLPHGLGAIPSVNDDPAEDEKPAVKKRKARATAKSSNSDVSKALEDAAPLAENLTKGAEGTGKSTKKSSKGKNNYGLTPGQTPYPDYPHPTPEECEEVTRLLSKMHGQVQAPKEVPAPSLTTTGCGEVPSVLDALIRTRLSAATSNTNSSRAFQGLVKRFGIIEEGIGKGSVNWDAVRVADTKDIFEAIKSGGLADVKSKDIKKILQMVHEENQARHDALVKNSSNDPAGAENESAQERELEVARAESNVLSLDHLHSLSSNDEIMTHLLRYPGIGVKTASCVLLFCFQRPSFAVDTHVFRLAKWLQWVPTDKNVTRDSTYAHLDVRIPDELKYPLHTLLIRHGKSCPRCRAITGVASEGWEKGCPIDHLVKRTGVRKGGGAEKSGKETTATPSTGRRKSKKKYVSEEEESELSDLGSSSGGDGAASEPSDFEDDD
ncbi:putative DNA glycosylase [Lasiodiplodia theobromae]|uniref:Putative DNA glycosylase n=2 Tax=Lasiodiplodia theobromae TaxID=45133 RepID=A0A5N5D688_9PEZI|nr:putative DNA glycosylase [Lasiodiplodia theobromae]